MEVDKDDIPFQFRVNFRFMLIFQGVGEFGWKWSSSVHRAENDTTFSMTFCVPKTRKFSVGMTFLVGKKEIMYSKYLKIGN